MAQVLRALPAARLQQVITIGSVLVAVAWAIGFWRMGHWGWALTGMAVIVGLYALVLGVEFILLANIRGDDPTPLATTDQLFRAWVGEVWCGPRVFCWRQPFQSRRWPDYLPANAQGRRGVLLVHGLFCNRGIWNRWLQRLTDDGVPFVAVNLNPLFGPIEGYADAIEQAVQTLERCTGLEPIVVGHSMGGLALRYWSSLSGHAARVHHTITLGTPHQGTWLARLSSSPSGRQMRIGSAWLNALRARESPGHDYAQRLTCFYSHCDNIVFPASTATLPGADNRHLPGIAHVHMVEAKEPWEELQRLMAPASQSPKRSGSNSSDAAAVVENNAPIGLP